MSQMLTFSKWGIQDKQAYLLILITFNWQWEQQSTVYSYSNCHWIFVCVAPRFVSRHCKHLLGQGLVWWGTVLHKAYRISPVFNSGLAESSSVCKIVVETTIVRDTHEGQHLGFSWRGGDRKRKASLQITGVIGRDGETELVMKHLFQVQKYMFAFCSSDIFKICKRFIHLAWESSKHNEGHLQCLYTQIGCVKYVHCCFLWPWLWLLQSTALDLFFITQRGGVIRFTKHTHVMDAAKTWSMCPISNHTVLRSQMYSILTTCQSLFKCLKRLGGWHVFIPYECSGIRNYVIWINCLHTVHYPPGSDLAVAHLETLWTATNPT